MGRLIGNDKGKENRDQLKEKRMCKKPEKRNYGRGRIGADGRILCAAEIKNQTIYLLTRHRRKDKKGKRTYNKVKDGKQKNQVGLYNMRTRKECKS